jgi:hypothetical protein
MPSSGVLMDGKKSVFSVSAWPSELGVAGPYHACVANMGAADKSCPAVEFVAPAWLPAVALLAPAVRKTGSSEISGVGTLSGEVTGVLTSG